VKGKRKGEGDKGEVGKRKERGKWEGKGRNFVQLLKNPEWLYHIGYIYADITQLLVLAVVTVFAPLRPLCKFTV